MGKIKIYRKNIKVNGVKLFYLDTEKNEKAGDGFGNLNKAVILCLHGLWGRGETWYDFMQNYGDRYRIIAPDMRGHGLSDKPEDGYTYDNLALDYLKLLDNLKLNKVILVGHSVGGAIAGNLAANYPNYFKAVAILDETAEEPTEEHKFPFGRNKIKDPITYNWPLPFATLNEAKSFIKNTAVSSLEYEYFMRSLREEEDGYNMMFSTKAVALIRANMIGWMELLPKMKMITMLVRSGSHKEISDVDFDKMKKLIPNCMAYEMSMGDHNVHLANKEEFYEYFDEFLCKVSDN